MFAARQDLLVSLRWGRGLGKRMQQIDREMRRLEAEAVATTSVAGRTGTHAEDGHSTVSGWCRALTTWSTGETNARVHAREL